MNKYKRLFFLSPVLSILFLSGCYEGDKNIVPETYKLNYDKSIELEIYENNIEIKDYALDNSKIIYSDDVDAYIPVFNLYYKIRIERNSNPTDSCFIYNGFNFFSQNYENYLYAKCLPTQDLLKSGKIPLSGIAAEGSASYDFTTPVIMPPTPASFNGLIFEHPSYTRTQAYGFSMFEFSEITKDTNSLDANLAYVTSAEGIFKKFSTDYEAHSSLFDEIENANIQTINQELQKGAIITGVINTKTEVGAADVLAELLESISQINENRYAPVEGTTYLTSNSKIFEKKWEFKAYIITRFSKTVDENGIVTISKKDTVIGVGVIPYSSNKSGNINYSDFEDFMDFGHIKDLLASDLVETIDLNTTEGK